MGEEWFVVFPPKVLLEQRRKGPRVQPTVSLEVAILCLGLQKGDTSELALLEVLAPGLYVGLKLLCSAVGGIGGLGTTRVELF